MQALSLYRPFHFGDLFDTLSLMEDAFVTPRTLCDVGRRSIRSFVPSALELVHDDGNNFSLAVEVPGLDKGDLTVKVKSGILSVSGTKTNEQKNDEGKVVRSKTYSVNTSYFLGYSVNLDSLKMTLENGVLTVSGSRLAEKSDRELKFSEENSN